MTVEKRVLKSSQGDVYDTEVEAIQAWNTRAERTCGNLWRADFMCTRCGTAFSAPNGLSYCPNCGARVEP